MPNHFHFLIKQNTSLPISVLIQKVCTSYSMYFNKKYKHVGHVFQGEFKVALIDDDSYLLWLSAYIHANPLVAGLIKDLASYKWSSFPEYLGLSSTNLCHKAAVLRQFTSLAAYQKFVLLSVKAIKLNKDLLIDN